MTPRDLELLAELEALVAAANSEAERYKADHIHLDVEAYLKYRDHCFMLIYEHFKAIASEMKYEPSNYYRAPMGVSHEEVMDSLILACRAEHDGGWVSNVLKKIGRQ